MMDPIPTVDRAFSMVIQFERQNLLLSDNDEDQVTMNVVDGRRSYGRGCGNYNNKMCTYCGKFGHTIEICYRKNGFPPGFKLKNNNNSAVNCATNGDEVDRKFEDSKYVKDQGGGTLTQEEYKLLCSLLHSNIAKVAAESPTTTSSSQACFIIRSSPDEGTHLDNFFTTCCSVQCNIDEWIIDYRALDHICSSLKWFCAYRKFNLSQLDCPTEHWLLQIYVGDVLLNKSIKLNCILYLPMFDLNLLSIPKLTMALNYYFSFSGESCFIQDLSKKMIGSGKMINGLYLLKQECSFSENNLVSLCN